MPRRKRLGRRPNHSTPAAAPSLIPAEASEPARIGIWSKMPAYFPLLAITATFVVPFVATIAARKVDEWYAPRLTFRTSEVVLKGGRVEDIRLKNEGSGLAKDVSVVVDGYFPGFVFTNKQHIHTHPNMPYEKTIAGGRLEVKLTKPLAPGQEVLVLVDEIPWTEEDKQTQIFSAWVSTDRGQATSQGAWFRSFPDMTINQFMGKIDAGWQF